MEDKPKEPEKTAWDTFCDWCSGDHSKPVQAIIAVTYPFVWIWQVCKDAKDNEPFN